MTLDAAMHRDGDLHRALRDAVSDRRCVFVAGLPGVGKSLLVQQLALLGIAEGRTVHLLQWDVARLPFDTPAILARYPEVNGVTHAAIRLAVGAWAREAVGRWDREDHDPRLLLVGETPLVGNRLLELARPAADEVEPLLASEATLFLVPVPTPDVRAHVEAARARDVVAGSGATSAAPHLVSWHWADLARVATRLGLAAEAPREYDPDVYAAVYRRLLRHRRSLVVPMDRVVAAAGPTSGAPGIAGDLVPTTDEVRVVMAGVAGRSDAELEREAARWWEI